MMKYVLNTWTLAIYLFDIVSTQFCSFPFLSDVEFYGTYYDFFIIMLIVHLSSTTLQFF